MNAVEVKDLRKVYSSNDKVTFEALRGMNFTVECGKFVVFAGASGSGKSTLFNCIGCIDTPTSGEIWINGKCTSKLDEQGYDTIRRDEIGFIFQSFNLIPVLSVKDNVEIPLYLKKMKRSERNEIVSYFLNEVGLYDKKNRLPSELSGGQCQRVSIARALVTKPLIVLADEPTANLDVKTGTDIIELMRKINASQQTTFLLSTHDQRVMERADLVMRIQDGQIIGEEIKC